MPKRFVLTYHAGMKIRQRELGIDWVERTARHPEWAQADPYRPEIERRFRAIEEFGGRVLRVACVETPRHHPCYKRRVRSGREAQTMKEMTYDPEADAVSITISRSRIDETEEIAPNVFVDRDDEGRIVAFEILTASKVLAPGDWQRARLPGATSADAAE
jgi:uncharacterized protein YuzE